MSNNVHDALFRATFSNVEHAAGELRRMLPPAIVARIDWSTLALEPGSFVDEQLAQYHTDLLFAVQMAGQTAYIYVLFEHQSTVDVLMPFRLLRYMVRVWDAWLANTPGAKKLRVIVPQVLHHSETGWTASTAFEELYDIDEDALAVLGKYVLRFSFVLDDISKESDKALRARAMSALGRLALFCFRHARSPEQILRGIGEWVRLVRETKRAPNGMAALQRIWQYIYAVNKGHTVEEVLAMLVEALGEEEREGLLSVADQLIERGRKAGLRDGQQEGERKMLLRQLGSRFGVLPDDVMARVKAADSAQLELWAERVLTASTLADVLGET